MGTLVAGGCHPLLASCVGLAVSVSLGAMTGHLIHRSSLPPFLVTLAGMSFARGAAFLVSMQPIGIDPMIYLPTPESGLGSARARWCDGRRVNQREASSLSGAAWSRF
ncbi:hypothetical protein WME89_06495 [Sorangium sp. So ce321]|uniref:hypothetical protein n=1 Tax=Sorangium sp. So ce321 TaxID=3133300 RepID=UPI003F5F84F5